LIQGEIISIIESEMVGFASIFIFYQGGDYSTSKVPVGIDLYNTKSKLISGANGNDAGIING
jgi:hypothetical protein